MKTFSTMKEALSTLLKEPYHAELIKEVLFTMYCVEEIRTYGETSSKVVILETEDDYNAAEAKYNLSTYVLESDETFTAGKEQWNKRVYIIDTAGNGIALFRHVPSCGEQSPSSPKSPRNTES